MSTESSVVERARAAIRGLSPYQPGKPIEELERELGITGAVKLASNENPRGPGPGGCSRPGTPNLDLEQPFGTQNPD